MRDKPPYLKLLFVLTIMVIFGCTQINIPKKDPNRPKKEKIMDQKIGKKEALKIAQQDAQNAYRDLSMYEVKIEPVNRDWKIDYELKDKTLRGGGPHYLISGQTGEIIEKRYEQ